MVSVALDFTGAHAFVAGGTSGINLGIAEGFAMLALFSARRVPTKQPGPEAATKFADHDLTPRGASDWGTLVSLALQLRVAQAM